MLPEAKLAALLDRHAILEARLAAGPDAKTLIELSREHAELTPVVETIRAWQKAARDRADLAEMLDDPATDAEMRALAQSEVAELEEALLALEHDVRLSLLPKDAADKRSVILEIRAGTGGGRGRAVRGRPVSHVRALCRAQGLEGGDPLGSRRHDGWLQGNHRVDHRRGRLRPAEV
jgi:peptide chain release factor 1